MALLGCGGRIGDATPLDTAIPSVVRADFVERVVHAICGSAAACYVKAGELPPADCARAVRAYWQPIVDHASSIHAAFDGEQAARCVTQIRFEWEQCADRKTYTSIADDLCARVFSAPSPRSQLGNPCEASMDCQQDDGPTVLCIRVSKAADVSGTCMRHLLSDADGPCGGAKGDYTANCGAPNVCGPTATCHSPFALGDSCDGLGGDTCGGGSVCDRDGSGLCRSANAFGTSCNGPNECENFACIDDVCRVSPDLKFALYARVL
jgi:hypothetical protein